MPTEAIIQVTNLRKEFNDLTAVADISFEVKAANILNNIQIFFALTLFALKHREAPTDKLYFCRAKCGRLPIVRRRLWPPGRALDGHHVIMSATPSQVRSR